MKSFQKIVIDSDNAMGSSGGDIDDAFAIAALVSSGADICALTSVFGNAPEPSVFENLRSMAQMCGFRGEILRGASRSGFAPTPASRFLSGSTVPLRVVALGPLTNVAAALEEKTPISEVIFVGTNLGISLPALRFIDFNQSCDPEAFKKILASPVAITSIPCNVARRLRLQYSQLDQMRGALGDFFRKSSQRWFQRARLLKASSTIPVWDLVAAMYLVDPSLFEFEDTTVSRNSWGATRYGTPFGRSIRVIKSFDPSKVWQRFFDLMRELG